MNHTRCHKVVGVSLTLGVWVSLIAPVHAQLIDNTQSTNTINAGINKSLSQEVGTGRGSVTTPDSSLFIIARDPFRAVRRGRQLFLGTIQPALVDRRDAIGDLQHRGAAGNQLHIEE